MSSFELMFFCINYIWAMSWEHLSYAIFEQQKRRSTCAFAQSDQRLCCSLLKQNNTIFWVISSRHWRVCQKNWHLYFIWEVWKYWGVVCLPTIDGMWNWIHAEWRNSRMCRYVRFVCGVDKLWMWQKDWHLYVISEVWKYRGSSVCRRLTGCGTGYTLNEETQECVGM